MTTFERRQRILGLLRDRPGIKVTEMAAVLDVSAGTIRNDLNALEDSGRVMRVRGGAVVKSDSSPSPFGLVPDGENAKQRIAQWAADLVANGDSILLDATATVASMVPSLLERRNLTVVTNGIETGLALAENPTHTVILVGGVLRPGSRWLSGHLGESNLEQLHVKTAFISPAGFSPDIGFTEIDHATAQLKRRMMASAERVVALVDSSKFGHVGLTPFAGAAEVDRIYTDSGIDGRYVDQLQQSCVVLTVCDRDSITSYTPCNQAAGSQPRHYRIGFANLGESEIPFAADVRRGLERAAAEAGNIDLVLADNQLDGAVALRVADKLIAAGVDLAIEYQIDEKAGSLIMEKFAVAGIPVIAVDIPMVGATFFGVNNYQAGHVAGRALGEWIRRHWQGRLDKLLVLQEPRAGALPAIRVQGQLDGLFEIIGEVPAADQVAINSGNVRSVSEANTRRALEAIPPDARCAVVSFNDDSAIGAIEAIRAMGREESAVVVGQGCDRLGRAELRRPDSLLVGATAYMPERYGARLLQLAQRILAHEPVPPAVYGEHTFITRDNLDLFYPSEPQLAPWPQRSQEAR